MKRFILLIFLLPFFGETVAQTLVANPQNNQYEGGELRLERSNSNYNVWNIDNYQGLLRFHHSGNTYFTTQPGGNIGIGTISPTSTLDVNGSFEFNGNLKYDGSFVAQNKDGNEFRAILAGGKTVQVANGGYIYAQGNDYPSYPGSVAMVAGNGGKIFLMNGNIGIGTLSPAEKLHLKNGLMMIDIANDQDNNSPGIVAVSNDDFLFDGQYLNNYGFGFHGYQDGSTSFSEPRNAYVSGYFGIDLFTSGLNRLRISRDGIVSIGTTQRQIGYKLAVNGKIKAKEIKVETGWADYVFKEDYDLPTLEQVENHIKEKGHLINIPSAKEVEENGVQLGEMNKLLLEKIEELTLYTLQQEKWIQLLLKSNSNLVQNQKESQKRIEQIEQALKKVSHAEKN